MDIDFDIIEQAGLTQGEFSDLVGYSRQTVNKWMSDDPIMRRRPSEEARTLLLPLLEKLNTAVREGRLPRALKSANAIVREERRRIIEEALQ